MAQTISQRISIDGASEATSDINALADAAEGAVQRISTAAAAVAQAGSQGVGALREAGQAVAGVVGEAGAAVKGTFAEIEGAVSGGIMTGLQNLGGGAGFGGVLNVLRDINPEVVAFGIGIGAIFAAAKSAATATEDLVTQAAALGMTTQDWQAASGAAAQFGVKTEELAKYMERATAAVGASRERIAAQAAAEDHAGDVAAAAAVKAQLAIEKKNVAIDDTARKQLDLGDASVTAAGGVTTANDALAKANEHMRELKVSTAGVVAGDKNYLTDQAKLTEASAATGEASRKVAEAHTKVAENARAMAGETEHAALKQDELTASMKEVVAPADKATKEIDQFIISTGAIYETDAHKRFLDMIEGLHQITNETDRARIGAQLFGRGWAGMALLVAAGSKEIVDRETEIRDSGLLLTDGEKEMGLQFAEAFNRMKNYFGMLSISAGNILGQIFTPMFDGISKFIAQNNDLIKELASGFVDIAMPALKAFGVVFGAVFETVAGVVRAALAVLDPLAKAINGIFGTNINGAALGFLLLIRLFPEAIGKWTGAMWIANKAISGLLPVLGTVGKAMLAMQDALIAFGVSGPLALGLVGLAFIALGVVIYELYEHWDKVEEAFKTDWEGLGKIWTALCTLISDSWNDTSGRLSTKGTAIANTIENITKVVRTLCDWFEYVLKMVDKLPGSAASVAAAAQASGATQSAGSAGGRQLAGGGEVRGPGGPTSDSVNIRASAGEFVHRTAAVRHYGLGFMQLVNSLQLPKLGGYALGGLVSALGRISPAPIGFAGGGQVAAVTSPGRPLTLNIDGKSFGLIAPESVVPQVISYARTQAMRSAGTKPSWAT